MVRSEHSTKTWRTSTCVLLAIANVPEIAPISDRRGALELGRPQLVFDVPVRIPVTGRIAERALQRCYGTTDGAFAPTRETGEGVLGSGTESFTVDSRSE